MTFSTFTAWFAANKTFIPAALASEIRRIAAARVVERMQSGYGASVLDFSDLILRGEEAIG